MTLNRKRKKKHITCCLFMAIFPTLLGLLRAIIVNVVWAPCANQNDVEGTLSIREGDALTLNWYLNVKTVWVCVRLAYRECNSIEAYPFQLLIISDYAVRDDWLLGPMFSSIRSNYQTAPVAHDLNLLNYSAMLCVSQLKTRFFNCQTSFFF